MAKSRRSMHKLLHSKTNPATTQFYSHSIAEGLRLYLLKPHTGKTHQLRVALTSLGTPILGDDLYGKHLSDRCYLHAYALAFNYSGNHYQYICYPDVGEWFLKAAADTKMLGWDQPFAVQWPKKR